MSYERDKRDETTDTRRWWGGIGTADRNARIAEHERATETVAARFSRQASTEEADRVKASDRAMQRCLDEHEPHRFNRYYQEEIDKL